MICASRLHFVRQDYDSYIFYWGAFVLTLEITRSQTSKHSKQLEDVRDGSFLEVIRRSALGLIAVYNKLPQTAVDAENVSDFEGALQTLLKQRAKAGRMDWRITFSPRMPMYMHPLNFT